MAPNIPAELSDSPIHLLSGLAQGSRKAYIVSLGCPKNLVDTERYVAILAEKGYSLTDSEEEADLLLVNTCGFIDNAKTESIDVILELAETKRSEQKLWVTGCLVDRYEDELKAEIPEVDLWFDGEHIAEIPASLTAEASTAPPDFRPLPVAVEPRKGEIQWASFPRVVLTPRHTAYLKISEGCDHSCGFCAIPSFKGKQRSVPLERLLSEARGLVENGTREITLIGQDTVAYGRDLEPKRAIGLRNLLEAIDSLSGLSWMRVLYTYPTRLADELEWSYRNLKTLVPYLDLPLQHLSDPVLERMRRGTPWAQIRDHVFRLRDACPDLVVRSTCIVGFPGETEEDFDLLSERFAELQVDHLGVFRYSDEEGTHACDLADKIHPEVSQERLEWMTDWAAEHCQGRAEKRLGGIVEVLVDRPCLPPLDTFEDASTSGRWWQGRFFGQAPEIDGEVFFQSDQVSEGESRRVRLEQARYPDYLATSLD
jgi:ribosomal protein S12 methylthiotransferase